MGALALSSAMVAASVSQQQPRPQRLLVVGDSLAASLFPYLRDTAVSLGIEAYSAAWVGCSVIDGVPLTDDGKPYMDVVMDPRRCPNVTTSLQDQMLPAHHPDVVVWLSGWESWPNRMLDGQVAHFGTIAGNRVIVEAIDRKVAHLTEGGARVVILPAAPNAYPSERGYPNSGDPRLVQLAKLLRSYAGAHRDKVSLIDLPMILCPNGPPCPAEVAPGIRPRYLDGFHFDGSGAEWLANQLIGMLADTMPAPKSPIVPRCADASVGARAPSGQPLACTQSH